MSFFFSTLQVLLVFIFCVFTSTCLCFSADTKPKPPKKHILNFEDELIQGRSQKPDLFYLFQKKNFNYKRLIRLRENFIPEMRQNSEKLNSNWNSN